MRIEGQRRSDNIEDRGRGSGGGGGLPVQALASVFRLLGVKGTLIAGAVLLVGFFLLPSTLRQQLLGALSGGAASSEEGAPGVGSACKASPANEKACDFSRVVLASTEDVWTSQFQRGALPKYRGAPGAYPAPT